MPLIVSVDSVERKKLIEDRFKKILGIQSIYFSSGAKINMQPSKCFHVVMLQSASLYCAYTLSRPSEGRIPRKYQLDSNLSKAS